MDEAVKSRIIKACRSGQAQRVLTILRSLEGEPGYVGYCAVAMFEDCKVGDGAIAKYLVHGADKHIIVNCTNGNRETPLHVASAHLNLQAVTEILSVDIGCDINIQTTTGDTPLHLAVKASNIIFSYKLKIIQLLLSSPDCDPNIRNSAGDTPFMVACKPVNHKVFSALISSNKCDPNIQDNDGNTALHFAALQDSLGTSTLVGCERYTPDITNNLGETPLHIACSKLNVPTVTVLLEEGMCDVNAQTNTGQTPLHLVLTANAKSETTVSVEIISQLLLQDRTCDPHIANAEGLRPLQIAYKTNIMAFTMILEKGCEEDYSKKNEMIEEAMALTNNDLLHWVIRMRAMSVLKHILKLKASPDIVNKVEASSGDTPLIAAIAVQYVEAVELLLDSQYCDPNVRSASNGDTPLIVACKKGSYLQIIHLLLSNDECDVNSQNDEGNTALHIAAAGRHHEAVAALVGHEGYKPDIVNNLCESPLHVACGELNVSNVATILKDNKCNVNLQTSTGQTALHMVLGAKRASKSQLIDCVVHLLAVPHCNPLTADAQGITPLQLVYQRDMESFALVLSRICKECYSNIICEVMEQAMILTDNNLLHLLSHCKAIAVMRYILNSRSSPAIVNKVELSSGDTPLMVAIKALCVDAVELLLDSQYCDPNFKTASHGDTPLIVACRMAVHHYTEDSLRILNALLSNEKCVTDINGQNEDGNTALHIAAEGNCEAVEAIVHNERCILNVANRNGEVPLHIASKNLQTRAVKILLKVGGCGVNHQTKTGQTSLHLAVGAKTNRADLKQAITKSLLGVADCDPNLRSTEGNTPLMVVCKLVGHHTSAYLHIIRALLSSKCDPHIQNNDGNTALHFAAASTCQETVRALVCNERYLPNVANKFGENPLHIACNKLHTKTVMALLEAGNCDVNLQTSTGQTPLHLAVRAQGNQLDSKVKIMQLLLAIPDCDPNIKCSQGDTPLFAACKFDYQNINSIISALTSSDKFDPNIQDSDGNTALHLATMKGCHEGVKDLVHCPSYKPDHPNKLCETSLHIACSQLNSQVVTVLLKEGRCDVNAQTNTGQTPLHLALAAKTSKRNVKKSIIGSILETPDCDSLVADANGVTSLKVAYKSDTEAFLLILERACENGYHKLKELIEQAMVLTDHNLLHVVSRKSATVVLRTLLKVETSSAIVNKVEDFRGDTPLIVAIKAQCVEAVELLLDSQYCDPNVRNVLDWDTPLIVACTNAAIHQTEVYAQIIRMLLSNNKCDVNGQNVKGNTALHIAISRRDQAVVNALVHHERYKPDIADNQGRTPLHTACDKLDVPTIMAILQHGKCNVNLQTSNGQTPLHVVLVAQETKPESKLAVINLLLSHPDCDTNDSSTQDASINNQQCDPNVKDSFGDTPLHIAVEHSPYDILEALLCSEQTDPNVQNHSGETPLHIACRLSKYDCVVAITKREQCDVNVREIHGQTALHKAIYNMQPEDISIIEHLISDSRCDLTACDLQGNTALHIACRKAAWKHDESIMTLIRRLLSTGKVSPQCVNNAGETPAQLAISNKNVYQELSHFSESQLKHPIETFVKVFVVGNAETGKSTMIKAICTEASKGRKFVPSQFKTVKGVKPHTAGIVPIPVQSRHFGNAIIYDFAGQHEYYSSHAAVLENLVLSSPPVFVLLVDLSKPFEQLLKTIAYWWSFIASYTARSHLDTPPHVIVVGSHKDVVKAKGRKVSALATKLLATLDGLPTNFIHVGFATLNCTLVASDGLTTLLSLLKNSCNTVRKELHIDLRCHVLSVFLQDKFPNSIACTLADVIGNIKAEESTLLPQSKHDLVNLLAALSDKDRILLLNNLKRPESSWIILQRQDLYKQINGSIFAPEYFDEHLTDFARSTGVVPLSKIKKHFPQHHPDIITGFLSHLEFCFKIGDLQTLELIADKEEYSPDEEFYFFPALVQVNNPPKDKVWKNEVQSPISKQNQHKLKYGWLYECSHPYQYLITRFLHVLQFRLAFSFALAMEHRPSHNFPAIRRRCSVWKRGIAWLNNDGIETVLEVGLQNQWVALLMQCSAGMEVECAKLRSVVVKIILDTKEEFCPCIGMYESLLHPSNIDYPFQRTDELSLYRLKEVSKVLVERKPCAVDEGGSNLIQLVELLPFELYTGLGDVFVTQLFTSGYTQQKITERSLKVISEILLSGSDPPVERLKLLARAFLPQVAIQLLVNQEEDPVAQCVSLIQKASVKTYLDLEEKLSSFSIFCGRNILDLAGLPPTFVECQHDSHLELTDDTLIGIESLLEVRTEVVPAAGHCTSLGLALGLSRSPTLQVIQHNWPDDVAFQLTEIIAAWLQDMGNSSWRSLAEALLDPAVDSPVIARAIMEKHTRNSHSEKASVDSEAYSEVDGAPLDESCPGDILPAVVQGGHFSWFHLGLVLGLHYGTLKAIQIDRSSHTECVAVVITKWLNQVDSVERQGQPSWRVLARALAHSLVGQRRLADDITRDHPVQEDATTPEEAFLPETASVSSLDSSGTVYTLPYSFSHSSIHSLSPSTPPSASPHPSPSP